MAKVNGRVYDSSDLKELMDNARGWARNWDDVLRYLRGPAQHDSDFSRKEVPQLIEDVKNLKKKHVRFNSDYRQVYEDITGKSGRNLSPPEGVKKPTTNPVELEDKYLKGMRFPTSKPAVLSAAKRHKAPPRVLNVLKEIENKKFKDMGMLLEAVGDKSWGHD